MYSTTLNRASLLILSILLMASQQAAAQAATWIRHSAPADLYHQLYRGQFCADRQRSRDSE